jgi:hypothetical protein
LELTLLTNGDRSVGIACALKATEFVCFFVVPSQRGICNLDPTAKMFPSDRLRTETDPVAETLCVLVFRIPDDGQRKIILKTNLNVYFLEQKAQFRAVFA